MVLFLFSKEGGGDAFEWKPWCLMFSHIKPAALECLQPNLSNTVDLNKVLRAPSLIHYVFELFGELMLNLVEELISALRLGWQAAPDNYHCLMAVCLAILWTVLGRCWGPREHSVSVCCSWYSRLLSDLATWITYGKGPGPVCSLCSGGQGLPRSMQKWTPSCSRQLFCGK